MRRRHPLATAVIALTIAATACSRPTDSRGELSTFDVTEPPSRTVTETREKSVAGVITERSTRTVTERGRSPPEPSPIVPDRDQPRAQSGLLTAGDHDDLLNPHQYAAYAERFLQAAGRDLPFVDTRTRVAVRVVGAGGRPVPFARVAVARPGGALTLTTAADGTASWFPRFDRVPADTSVRVAAPGAQATTVRVPRNRRSLTVQLAGDARPVQALDLVLVLDTTGSMGDEMAYLQAELDTIVARLRREAGNLDIRLGLVVYRDEGDDYVVRSSPLTRSLPGFRTLLSRQEAHGGGDMPEAMDRAMRAAAAMDWRPDAAKALLLVADAPPHEDALAPTLATVEAMRADGVQIVPVAASGVDPAAEYVMRTMGALTHGRYIFLTDDSGVGNQHAEPDLACYLVTRLDQLIARVLAGIVAGRRIEPRPDEVIRQIGAYDHGRCTRPGAAAGQS